MCAVRYPAGVLVPWHGVDDLLFGRRGPCSVVVAVLLFGVGSMPGRGMAAVDAGAAPSVAAEAVFETWIEALRTGAVEEIKGMTSLPFFAVGSSVDEGPGCKGIAFSGQTSPIMYSESMLRMDAREVGQLVRLVACLREDSMLVSHIPDRESGGWKPGAARSHNSGKIRAITEKGIARGLRRFRKEIHGLVKTHKLVEAKWTDNSGITITAVGAFRQSDGGGAPKLAAFFVHELFEE